MLTTLSRRGSRVQSFYVCISCLGRIRDNSASLPLASDGEISTRSFHSTTPTELDIRRIDSSVGTTHTGYHSNRSINTKSNEVEKVEKESEWDRQLRVLRAAKAAAQNDGNNKPAQGDGGLMVQRNGKAEEDASVQREKPTEDKLSNGQEISKIRKDTNLANAQPSPDDNPSSKTPDAKRRRVVSKRASRASSKKTKSQEVQVSSEQLATLKDAFLAEQSSAAASSPTHNAPLETAGAGQRDKAVGVAHSNNDTPKGADVKSETTAIRKPRQSKNRPGLSSRIAARRNAMIGKRNTPKSSTRERSSPARFVAGKPTSTPEKSSLARFVAGKPSGVSVDRPPTTSTFGENRFNGVRSARYTPKSSLSEVNESGKPRSIETIDVADLKFQSVNRELQPVPRLSYGLDRVLFNPGVYHLQDPRSKVYNFDPYLQEIMPVNQFDFTLLKRFITSSKDKTLLETTKNEGKKYTGSTSSMTASLSHFHYLISQWRPINVGNLSKDFDDDSSNFTTFQRIPSAMFLRWKDGVYAIDADKQFDTASVLSMLGQSMEKLLTLSTKDFEKYRKNSSEPVSEESRTGSEAYHYSTMGDFLMRSQLDAYDPRIPGTGMFDLKTRAVISIRMDTESYEKGRGYEIRSNHGQWESFEREYYDMIRSAFMKYSLQVRIGRMDGIFVAFHNTERIFGFQYISLPEMDLALHGTNDTALGDSEFKASLELLNRVLDRATAKWPKRSLRLFFETRGKEGESTYMYIFAKPVDENRIEQIQNSNKAKIEEFEARVLGLSKQDPESLKEAVSEWETLQTEVENSMLQDASDPGAPIDTETNGEFASVEDKAPTSPWDEPSGVDVTTKKLDKSDDNLTENDRSEAQTIDTPAESTITRTLGQRLWSLLPKFGSATSSTSSPGDPVEGTPSDGDNKHIGDGSDAQAAQSNTTTTRESDRNVTGNVGGSSTQEFVDEDAELEGQETASSGTKKALPSGEAESRDTEFASNVSAASDSVGKGQSPDQGLLAMYLTIRNKVNGVVVQRPENLRSSDKWTVEYALAEIEDPKKARMLYDSCKARRRLVHLRAKSDGDGSVWNQSFMASIRKYTEKGRKFRKQVNAEQANEPVKVLTINPEHLRNWQNWSENGRSQEQRKSSNE